MKAESFSLATASARIGMRQGVATSCRVALGACIPFPVRLTHLEQALTGIDCNGRTTLEQTVNSALEGLAFLSKEGMSKEYIRHLAAVTLTDAIVQAAQNAQRRRS